VADPNAEKPDLARKIQHARKTLPAEFDRAMDPKMPFTPLPDPDAYAPMAGFSDGFPMARDRHTGKMWLVHCYGMVGAGRDNDPDSGGGTELYVVIGNAPRQLDRNVTLFGASCKGWICFRRCLVARVRWVFTRSPSKWCPSNLFESPLMFRKPSEATWKLCEQIRRPFAI